MADAGKTRADEAARLEAALDRIARARPHRTRGEKLDQGTAELATRLDALIAELRQVLGRESSD